MKQAIIPIQEIVSHVPSNDGIAVARTIVIRVKVSPHKLSSMKWPKWFRLITPSQQNNWARLKVNTIIQVCPWRKPPWVCVYNSSINSFICMAKDTSARVAALRPNTTLEIQ